MLRLASVQNISNCFILFRPEYYQKLVTLFCARARSYYCLLPLLRVTVSHDYACLIQCDDRPKITKAGRRKRKPSTGRTTERGDPRLQCTGFKRGFSSENRPFPQAEESCGRPANIETATPKQTPEQVCRQHDRKSKKKKHCRCSITPGRVNVGFGLIVRIYRITAGRSVHAYRICFFHGKTFSTRIYSGRRVRASIYSAMKTTSDIKISHRVRYKTI